MLQGSVDFALTSGEIALITFIFVLVYAAGWMVKATTYLDERAKRGRGGDG